MPGSMIPKPAEAPGLWYTDGTEPRLTGQSCCSSALIFGELKTPPKGAKLDGKENDEYVDLGDDPVQSDAFGEVR